MPILPKQTIQGIRMKANTNMFCKQVKVMAGSSSADVKYLVGVGVGK